MCFYVHPICVHRRTYVYIGYRRHRRGVLRTYILYIQTRIHYSIICTARLCEIIGFRRRNRNNLLLSAKTSSTESLACAFGVDYIIFERDFKTKSRRGTVHDPTDSGRRLLKLRDARRNRFHPSRPLPPRARARQPVRLIIFFSFFFFSSKFGP